MENNYSENHQSGNNKRNTPIFFGVLLILAAVALILNQIGMFSTAFVWPVIITLVLLIALLECFHDREFVGILFVIGLLVVIDGKHYLQLAALENISGWVIICAALLAGVGLNILFPGFKKSRKNNIVASGRKTVSEETRSGDMVSYVNSFGSSVRYLAGSFEEVNVKSSFGAIEVFFTNAEIKNNAARVYVDGSFGEVKLHIPASWKVVVDASSSLGNIKEVGHCDENGAKILNIAGNISFAELEINYV